MPDGAHAKPPLAMPHGMMPAAGYAMPHPPPGRVSLTAENLALLNAMSALGGEKAAQSANVRGFPSNDVLNVGSQATLIGPPLSAGLPPQAMPLRRASVGSNPMQENGVITRRHSMDATAVAMMAAAAAASAENGAAYGPPNGGIPLHDMSVGRRVTFNAATSGSFDQFGPEALSTQRQPSRTSLSGGNNQRLQRSLSRDSQGRGTQPSLSRSNSHDNSTVMRRNSRHRVHPGLEELLAAVSASPEPGHPADFFFDENINMASGSSGPISRKNSRDSGATSVAPDVAAVVAGITHLQYPSDPMQMAPAQGVWRIASFRHLSSLYMHVKRLVASAAMLVSVYHAKLCEVILLALFMALLRRHLTPLLGRCGRACCSGDHHPRPTHTRSHDPIPLTPGLQQACPATLHKDGSCPLRTLAGPLRLP